MNDKKKTMSIAQNFIYLKKTHVNRRLLPIKLHYFFMYGAVGSVMSFLPLVAKEMGISATAVGIFFTILPFIVMLSKPAFGALTDYLQNLKIVIVVLIIVASSSYFSILYIPRITSARNATLSYLLPNCEIPVAAFRAFNYSLECLNNLPKKYKTACADHKIGDCLNSQIIEFIQNDCDNESINATTVFHSPLLLNSSISKEFTNKTLCSCDNLFSFVTKFNSCILNGSDVKNSDPYKTWQFWIFALLAIVSGICSYSLFSLSDAACYEILGDEPQLYGRQRLWATISWGFSTLFVGYLNDKISVEGSSTNYSPGFYLMVCLMLIDLVVLIHTVLVKANFSSSICKDIRHMFSSFEIITFAIGVFVMGGLSGLLWQYQFWFLQDLGANQLLLGLTVAVQCLVAEVPLFFVAGKIIRIFGHSYCLIGSFVAFALRYALYFVLKNPWYVLPIELLHGVTFGIFYATMTSFANSKAPPGTEATMMGVFGGLFEGLGIAAGSLLGGLGFDTVSGPYTFLIASGISATCSVIFFFIRFFKKPDWCSKEVNDEYTIRTEK